MNTDASWYASMGSFLKWLCILMWGFPHENSLRSWIFVVILHTKKNLYEYQTSALPLSLSVDLHGRIRKFVSCSFSCRKLMTVVSLDFRSFQRVKVIRRNLSNCPCSSRFTSQLYFVLAQKLIVLPKYISFSMHLDDPLPPQLFRFGCKLSPPFLLQTEF